jgi:hypothetical protein
MSVKGFEFQSDEGEVFKGAVDFALAPEANAGGTSFKDSIHVAPQALIAAFGEPVKSDGYKVSGEYVFRNDEGEVFTVYDWKMTTLYDGENTLRPHDLWDLESPIEFHIGGKTGAGAFIEWLKRRVRR